MTSRREQVRGNRAASQWRSITVTKDQLDRLEKRGYLEPDRRGDRADESNAIETFVMDSLLKG
jgi:hypothetical protein